MACRAALHAVCLYESFRGEGRGGGFGKGRGHFFKRGPSLSPIFPFPPQLRKRDQIVVAALDDVGIDERAGLDAGAADVNHTVDFGGLKPRAPGMQAGPLGMGRIHENGQAVA